MKEKYALAGHYENDILEKNILKCVLNLVLAT